MSKALLVFLVVAAFATACLGQADKYPAGVSPASCPNYPFCNTGGQNVPVGYSFDFTRFQYPPGIHPAACPHYPYC